jgi:hypothetical protein
VRDQGAFQAELADQGLALHNDRGTWLVLDVGTGEKLGEFAKLLRQPKQDGRQQRAPMTSMRTFHPPPKRKTLMTERYPNLPQGPDPGDTLAEQIQALSAQVEYMIVNLVPTADEAQQKSPIVQELEELKAQVGLLSSQISQMTHLARTQNISNRNSPQNGGDNSPSTGNGS